MKVKMPKTKAELTKYFAVRYKGKVNMYLSPAFAIRRNVDIEDLKTLKNIHRNRLKLFDKIEAEEDPEKLKELAKEITEIDYQLQDAWGFDRDDKFHTWWYQLPKCMCPRFDNIDSLGIVLSFTRQDCPLHGWSEEEREVHN